MNKPIYYKTALGVNYDFEVQQIFFGAVCKYHVTDMKTNKPFQVFRNAENEVICELKDFSPMEAEFLQDKLEKLTWVSE